jgi:hypothetical protein
MTRGHSLVEDSAFNRDGHFERICHEFGVPELDYLIPVLLPMKPLTASIDSAIWSRFLDCLAWDLQVIARKEGAR